MTSVKGNSSRVDVSRADSFRADSFRADSFRADFSEADPHVPQLMGELFSQVRDLFAHEDWHGMRLSHFRVANAIPAEGISVTELADKVGMSKQGCGQFVAHLSSTGHLVVEASATDRRVRVVRRTPEGERLVARVSARIALIEADWAAIVGERRFATFRRVLQELARG